MILDITYSNIRVFRDDAVLSMEASDAVDKGDNVMKVNVGGECVRVLKVGAVYGANSAGKTTLIYAVYILREWLQNKQVDYFDNVICPFALDDYSSEKPSSLGIRFVTNGMLFHYYVGFHKGKCKEEVLTKENANGSELLFKRITPRIGNHSIEYGPSLQSKELPVLEVASDASILSLFNSMAFEPISAAARYLTSIEIANSYNSLMMRMIFSQVRPWLNKPGNRKRLVDFENCFDINLKDIKIPQKAESTPGDIKYVHQVLTRDGESKKDFNSDLESTGTQTLTILGAKVLQALDEGRPLMVDEFDSGFHTEVTRTVIEMFRDPEINRKKAQLILTTHNVDLMNEHVLRKDQIWFIEKTADGASDLFSLAEFDEVNETTDFSEWYLAKRFGAVPTPNLLTIRRLFCEE